MAYDPAIGKLVLFGGDEINSLGDTWTYDGRSWAQQHPATSPPARAGAAMAYDPAIGKLVLYGGVGINEGSVFTDTWTYDGETWTQVGLAVPLQQQHPTSEPAVWGYISMAYDPDLGKLFVFGTPKANGPSARFETWTYNGTTWTRASPAGSPPGQEPEGPVVYDAALKKFVLYTDFQGPSGGGETWTYDGTAWAKQAAARISNLTEDMAMAYNPATGQTVVFGGFGFDPMQRGSAGPPTDATRTYDGTTWTNQSPPTAPSPRYRTVMAYDPALNGLVLFGGDSGGQLADTWTYAAAQKG
jgi:hypothetical protein